MDDEFIYQNKPQFMFDSIILNYVLLVAFNLVLLNTIFPRTKLLKFKIFAYV